MLKACGVVGNRDLEPFIPALVSCIVRVAETPEIVHKMSATTFVQAVESPALAIMVPFLVRAQKGGTLHSICAIHRLNYMG